MRPLHAALICMLVTARLSADEVSAPAPSSQIAAVVKKGEIYQLETVAPLIDGPDRVTVLEYGPKNWVLVGYEVSVLLQGALQPTNRKSQMWVNFDHVVAARRVDPAAPAPTPAPQTPTPTAATPTTSSDPLATPTPPPPATASATPTPPARPTPKAAPRRSTKKK